MSGPNQDGSGRTIRSVDISFNVIDTLQNNGKMTITELANQLDHSKSTISSHLRTLKKRQIIVRDPEGYRLSLKILNMANRVRDQIGNYDVIREEVDKLAEDTGEIAQFGIEEHGSISYLYKSSGNNSVETASRVGTQQPMYSTSLGKTILAFLPADRREEIIRTMEFTPKTPKTIRSREDLLEQLDQIVDQGYGIDDEENIEGLRCVSAPVKNDETVVGAVSLTGPASRFVDEKIHGELADRVKRAANVIEINTKFSG